VYIALMSVFISVCGGFMCVVALGGGMVGEGLSV
jgi:hypothetical protein